MKNYTVRYALPAALGFSGDEVFNFTYDGISVSIKCKDIEGSTLTSYTTKDVNWLNTNEKTAVITSKNKFGDQIPALKLYLDESKELQSNGYEVLSQHTVVDICIKGIDESAAIAFSEQVLEYFINMYRYIFNEENLPFITPKDSSIIVMLDSTNANSIHLNKSVLTSTCQWIDPFKDRLLRTKPVDINKIPMFDYYLNSRPTIPVWQKLLIDAKDQALIRKSYDMSIVLSETAFECFIQTWLTARCQRKGIKKLTYKEWDTNKKIYIAKNTPVKNILNSNINKLINCSSELINIKLKDTQYYKEWHEKAYDLRNGIIHGGISGYDEVTAKTSFDVTYKFIIYLEGLS